MPLDTRNLQMSSRICVYLPVTIPPTPDRNIDEDAVIAQRLGSITVIVRCSKGGILGTISTILID